VEYEVREPRSGVGIAEAPENPARRAEARGAERPV